MVTKQFSNISFMKILGAIIISWILINLWTMAIKVFFYEYIGLSKTSVMHTLAVALGGTVAFIIYVNCIGEERCCIQSKMTGIVITPTASAHAIIDSEEEENETTQEKSFGQNELTK